MIYQLLVGLTLTGNAVTDWKTRKIYDFPIILTLIIGIALSHHPMICVAGILTAILCGDFPKSKIGSGDIDALILIFTATGTALGLVALLTILLVVVWRAYTKETSIPLVSFLCMSYWIWWILERLF